MEKIEKVFQEEFDKLKKEFRDESEELIDLLRDMALLKAEIAVGEADEEKKRSLRFLLVGLKSKLARLRFRSQVAAEEVLKKIASLFLESLAKSLL